MARLSLDNAAWESRWRSRSTAEKVLLSTGLVFVALTATGPTGGLSVIVLSSLCAVVWARVPAGVWTAAVTAPVVFVSLGLVGIVVTFSEPVGRVVLEVGPAAVTEPALWRGAEVAFRAVAASTAVLLLATTTPMPYLLASLGRIKSLRILAEIAALVYRMLFELLDAQSRIREAQAARLGYSGTRIAIRSVGLLAGSTLLRAWVKSHRLEEGLSGRGYAGAWLELPQRRPVDRGFVVLSALIVCGAFLASWWGPSWPA